MWNTPDEELIALGTRELISLGLAADGDVERGYVVRVPKAYPYYDFSYKANVGTIRKWIETEAPNIHPVGRNGMHKYNNQDHSMYTAMLTVENIYGADPRHLVGQRRGGVPRGGLDREGRPGAATAHERHGEHARRSAELRSRPSRSRRGRPSRRCPCAAARPPRRETATCPRGGRSPN